jgi:hypothetical protein
VLAVVVHRLLAELHKVREELRLINGDHLRMTQRVKQPTQGEHR